MTTPTITPAAKALAEQLIAWGSVAYTLGFATVLVHTAHLGLPVLELVKSIYIWVGLPLAIVAILARWSYKSIGPPLIDKLVASKRSLVKWAGHVLGFLVAYDVASKTQRLSLIRLMPVAAVAIAMYIWRFYPWLPQTLGGGAPAAVIVLLDSERVPKQTLALFGASDVPPDSGASKVLLSGPVELLYTTTSDYYIRVPTDTTLSLQRAVIPGIIWR